MKVRPIDANLLKEKLKELLKDFDKSPTKKYVVRTILSMLGDDTQTPTLDYEPVVHAHWMVEREPNEKIYCFHCSNCDSDFSKISNKIKSDFCPDCGAKMDEEVN